MGIARRENRTDAQRSAQNKYDAKTFAVLGCKVKKEEAEAFKHYCVEHGKTTNTALKEYVMSCITPAEDKD